MERAIFAHSIAEQEIENGSWFMTKFTITLHDRRGVCLEILTDSVIRFAQKSRPVGGLDLGRVRGQGKGIPMEEIATAPGAVKRDLVSAQDETGNGVPRVANAGQIAPGACGVAGMNSDAVAVNAAGWFAD
jgi:hypothetical protein